MSDLTDECSVQKRVARHTADPANGRVWPQLITAP
jgi:hypothetical protein